MRRRSRYRHPREEERGTGSRWAQGPGIRGDDTREEVDAIALSMSDAREEEARPVMIV